MTSIAPDVDVDEITHLDFTPPCEATDGCDSDAVWIITYRHMLDCCPSKYLMCDNHIRVIRWGLDSDATLRCLHWRVIGPIRKHLDRIEPL